MKLLLTLSIVFNLATQHVDYTNDFRQAPLDQIVFVELLEDFKAHKTVLLLQKSV